MTPAPTPIRQSVVIFARNKRRVSAFYRQTLGLVAAEEASSHDLLQGPGIEIVIHAIPRKFAASIVITKPPQVREDTPIKPVFWVPDLSAVRNAAESTGGFLKPIEAAWLIRGATVLDGWDPEGNVLQFKQAAAG
jgi:predicted enzyme related to lactoylglutathione lyase